MLKLAIDFQISFIDYPILSEWCTSLYTVGCPHNCPGCHNEPLKDKDYPHVMEMCVSEWLIAMSEFSEYNKSDNFVIVGGEPLAPWNIDSIRELLMLNTKYNICLYTGYDVEYVKSHNIKGFKFLKTGKYDKNTHNDLPLDQNTVFNLGSSNQKLWDSQFNLISNNGIFKGK